MSSGKSRVLVIDGQIFQSAARDRGMGRYSEYLTTAILAEGAYDEVHVLFSKKNYSPSIVTKELDTMFEGVKTAYLDLSNTTKQNLRSAEDHNKRAINKFITGLGHTPSDIDYLIPSAFQEPIVSVYPDATNNFLIFYDLIPYLYHERYADKMPFDNYLERFRLLFQSDGILAISGAVRDDLAVYLGIPHERISVIDGAAIKSSRPLEPIKGFDLPAKFILMPTSDDPRKNNLRAVLGFEAFNTKSAYEYKLIITSKIHRSERERLQAFSKNILFTGNISEAELDWLYEKSDVVLFTPESEGLGLPVLEAVQVNKRVVCSSIEVFKEISTDAFYFCNHEDQYSIADAIERACAGVSVDKKEYARILKHYSWPQTAKRSIKAMAATKKEPQVMKPKIAIFTPAPDGFSAVGKVVAEAHPVLSRHFDIDYYAEQGEESMRTRPNYLRLAANYYPAESFSVRSYASYDAVFYHIGNSQYHLDAIANSLYLPGIAILHDTNLTDAYRVMVNEQKISKKRSELERTINESAKLKRSKYLTTVVMNQQVAMTHSVYTEGAVQEIAKGQVPEVSIVNLATQTPITLPARDYTKLRLGMAGIIADIKGIEVIEEIAKDPRHQSHAISIFGYNYASEETLDRLRHHDTINLATNLTDLDFVRSMRKLDIFVNYRMQYQGETSLSTLEAMRQGVVVVVRDTGWYSELPDDAVVKVKDTNELALKLGKLMSDTDALGRMSRRAVEYVRERHGHEQYAEGMKRAISIAADGKGRVFETAKALQSGSITSKADLLRLETTE